MLGVHTSVPGVRILTWKPSYWLRNLWVICFKCYFRNQCTVFTVLYECSIVLQKILQQRSVQWEAVTHAPWPPIKNSLSTAALGFRRMTCRAVLPRKEKGINTAEKRGKEHMKSISWKCFAVDIVWMINWCQSEIKAAKTEYNNSCFQFVLIGYISYKGTVQSKYIRCQRVKEVFTKKSLFKHKSYWLRDCLWTDLNLIGQILLYITWTNRRLIDQTRRRI